MTMLMTRDGTKLYSKVWGEGRPVVLIHGWPLSADSWDPVALALAEAGFRAIAYDRRGFGRSDQPWYGYDYDTFSDDLADVIKFHEAADDVALIGFSMGGGEVARYMARHRGKGVSAVALISSVVPYMLRDETNPDGVPPDTFAEIQRGLRDDRAHFLTGFFKQFFGVGLLDRPVSQEVLDQAWTCAMQAGLHPTLAAAKAFATTDFRRDLASITVPTLLIHGTADKTVPIEATSREVARRLPLAQLVEYAGEPHGLFATQPAMLIEDLVAFLNGDIEGLVRRHQQTAIDLATASSLAAPAM